MKLGLLTDLWYFEGPPDQDGNLSRIFNAVPHRILFVGHYHQWLLATPQGFIDWQGDRRICLDEGRYFVVVGALCDGHFATFDTETMELVPMTPDADQTDQMKVDGRQQADDVKVLDGL